MTMTADLLSCKQSPNSPSTDLEIDSATGGTVGKMHRVGEISLERATEQNHPFH